MTTTSAIVNRALRETVGPVLRELGFEKADARNGWRWLDKSIWVFNIRAVGAYFSDVTGWPPGSVGASLGVYYSFMPMDLPIKRNEGGRLLPAEHFCQMRTHLDCALDQGERTQRLRNPAERRRTDIWWVEPDGSSAGSVAADIAQSLKRVGGPWLSRQSELATALGDVETERDCLVKFDKAALLAKEIGDQARWRRYATLAVAEATRLGRNTYAAARYGL